MSEWGHYTRATCKKQVLYKNKSSIYNETVAKRAYGQYCGFARALEMVGERWAFLIIRDLFTGQRRFSDLQRGLPKIPSNILAARLRELENDGLVERRALSRGDGGGVVYQLTKTGRDLEDSVVALSRWGAKRLGDPRSDEVVTDESMIMALRTTFRPEAAKRVRARYELRMGQAVLHAVVNDGKVEVGKGPLSNPDVVVEAGPGLRALMAQEVTPLEGLKAKIVRMKGNRKLFMAFPKLFRI